MLYFVALFTLLLLFNHFILVVGLFIAIVGACCYYFDTPKIRRLVIGSLTFMGMIILFNILLNQTGSLILWQWKIGIIHFRLTETAIIYGLTMAFSLGSMIIAFVLFNSVITIPKLSYLLFPVVPRLAMLLTISLRLVELFIQKMMRLVMFQKNRNILVTEGSFGQRLRKMGTLLRIILVGAVSSAMETAVLMEARGFGAKRRSQYQRFHFQLIDGLFLGASVALFMVILGLRLHGWGWTTDVTQVRWQLKHDWLVAALLISYIALPILGEEGYRLWQN